ncbi:MAG: class I SAM-dependent methyltransferase, partial [Chitinophagales bacterium]
YGLWAFSKRNSVIILSIILLSMSFRWKIAQWFERRWWKNYLKKKTPTDYLTWKKNYWNGFLQEINLSLEKTEAPIIDIGCGPAGIFTIFQNEKITALDPLLEQYEKDLLIFDKEKYPQTSFITQDFETATIKEKYTTVFCLNAINHFHDLKNSLQKLNNITSLNGKLILSIDAHNHSFFKHLFRLLPLDILHPHQYDLVEYTAMLEENGFEIKGKFCQKKAFFFDYWVLTAEKVLLSQPKK